jgi:hypothetical protein
MKSSPPSSFMRVGFKCSNVGKSFHRDGMMVFIFLLIPVFQFSASRFKYEFKTSHPVMAFTMSRERRHGPALLLLLLSLLPADPKNPGCIIAWHDLAYTLNAPSPACDNKCIIYCTIKLTCGSKSTSNFLSFFTSCTTKRRGNSSFLM